MILCIIVCVKMLPQMTILYSAHVSANLSTFSFISPTSFYLFFIFVDVHSNLSIEISHENGHILFSALIQDACAVKLVLGFFIAVVRWCTTLDDIHLDFLFVVLNDTVMIHGPFAYHPINAFYALLIT